MLLKNQTDGLIFFKIPTFLFTLLPFFLISGPFLSDLSVSLISIIFLIYCFKYKNFSYFKNNYFYIFLAFCIYLILNSLLNNFNINSFKTSIFYFRFGVFVIAIFVFLKFDNQFLKSFYNILLISFSILIMDGFWQYFFEINLLGWPKVDSYRISSLFGDELILGSYISRLFPILFALGILYHKKNRIKFTFLILIFILAEVLIFLSGERTSFFYLNISAIFIIFFSTNLKIIRLATMIFSILIIILISLFNEKAKIRIIDKTINQIVPEYSKNLDSNKEQQIYIFSKQHTHHYISAYKMFVNNKLFGVGLKNFRNFCDLKPYKVSNLSCSTHPHNTYIQLLSETGLVGTMFVLIVLAILIINLLRHIKMRFLKSFYFNDFEICILSGILITIWPFAPSGNFFNNWLCVIYFLSLPIFFWSRYNGVHKK